jgi:hypothetical protein
VHKESISIAVRNDAGKMVLEWASRSLKREFELVIMVEVWIEEMFRSD